MSSQVHYFDLSFPAQQGDHDSFVEAEQKVLCCTAAPSYKACALCIEPLSIPWHSFPCSSLIPWTFLHFQNLTDGTFTLFSVSSSFQVSFFPGILNFDGNFSFKNPKPEIFPTSVSYVLKHNIGFLCGGSASHLFINVSDFLWPRCYRNLQAAHSGCSCK